MTKQEYIKAHGRSMLAANLAENDWPDDQVIEITYGLDTLNDKRSNLYKALERSKIGEYIRGGHRQRGTEGWFFAVR